MLKKALATFDGVPPKPIRSRGYLESSFRSPATDTLRKHILEIKRLVRTVRVKSSCSQDDHAVPDVRLVHRPHRVRPRRATDSGDFGYFGDDINELTEPMGIDDSPSDVGGLATFMRRSQRSSGLDGGSSELSLPFGDARPAHLEVSDERVANYCIAYVLRRKGYSASVVTPQSRAYVSSRHTFVIVHVDGGDIIVDAGVRMLFEIATPTDSYSTALENLPRVFVGTYSEMRDLIRAMTAEARNSFELHEMHFPPWREADVLSQTFDIANATLLTDSFETFCRDMDQQRALGSRSQEASVVRSLLGESGILEKVDSMEVEEPVADSGSDTTPQLLPCEGGSVTPSLDHSPNTVPGLGFLTDESSESPKPSCIAPACV